MKILQRHPVVSGGVALAVIVVGTILTLARNTGRSEPVGSLTYPVDEAALRNPWLLAASRWPSLEAAEVARLAREPSPGERQHFSRWVQGTVPEPLLPQDFDSVPYLADWGFVHVKEARGYRVRVREATRPAYVGAAIMTKSVVMAVEPLAGQLPVPRTQDAMVSLLGQFVRPGVLTAAEYVLPAVSREQAGGYFLARWPAGGPMPVQLYAWTDGKILLIALYEDIQYSEGPRPAPQVEATPAPSEEEGEIHSESTPDQQTDETE